MSQTLGNALINIFNINLSVIPCKADLGENLGIFSRRCAGKKICCDFWPFYGWIFLFPAQMKNSLSSEIRVFSNHQILKAVIEVMRLIWKANCGHNFNDDHLRTSFNHRNLTKRVRFCNTRARRPATISSQVWVPRSSYCCSVAPSCLQFVSSVSNRLRGTESQYVACSKTLISIKGVVDSLKKDFNPEVRFLLGISLRTTYYFSWLENTPRVIVFNLKLHQTQTIEE